MACCMQIGMQAIRVCDLLRATHTLMHDRNSAITENVRRDAIFTGSVFILPLQNSALNKEPVIVYFRFFAHHFVKYNSFERSHFCFVLFCKLTSTVTCFSWPFSHKNEAPSYYVNKYESYCHFYKLIPMFRFRQISFSDMKKDENAARIDYYKYMMFHDPNSDISLNDTKEDEMQLESQTFNILHGPNGEISLI